MKRPVAIWLITIIILLYIISNLIDGFDYFMISNDITLSKEQFSIALYYAGVSVISSALIGIFLYFFFRQKKSSIKFLYLGFGFSYIIALLNHNWLAACLIVLFGILLWFYIKKAKVDGKRLFI